MTDAPERILATKHHTHGEWIDAALPFYDMTHLVSYTRTDIADAAHRAGYELARAEAAKLGAHIRAYDVVMKG